MHKHEALVLPRELPSNAQLQELPGSVGLRSEGVLPSQLTTFSLFGGLVPPCFPHKNR